MSASGTYCTGGYDASCNVNALTVSATTFPATVTVTRAPVGSMVMGWSGPGSRTCLSVMLGFNTRTSAHIPKPEAALGQFLEEPGHGQACLPAAQLIRRVDDSVRDRMHLDVGLLRSATKDPERRVRVTARSEHHHALGLVDDLPVLGDACERGLDLGLGLAAPDLGEVDEVALDPLHLPLGVLDSAPHAQDRA